MRRLTPSCCALAGLLLAAGPLPAQEDEITWETIFRGTTDVNLVNVDVVVTGKNGEPVTGLGVGDFRLFENGKQVEITNFYAAAGAPGPSVEEPEAPAADEQDVQIPRRLHYMVLFVDQANIAETNRARIFARLREFLLERWRPDLRVMVASNGRTLAVHSDGFARAPHDVFVALESIQSTTSVGQRFDVERRQLLRDIGDLNVEACSGFFATTQGSGQQRFQEEICLEVTAAARSLLPRIRGLAEQQMVHTRQTLGVIEEFVAMASGLGGRKSVVYISDGLPVRPARALFDGLARRLDPIAAEIEVRPDLETQRYDLSLDFEGLVTRANTGGVAFYTLYSPPSSALMRGSAATTAGSGGNFGNWSSDVAAGIERTFQESLIIMAEETGGRYALGADNADAVLSGLIEDGDSYYSLGYIGKPLAEETARDVRVEATNGSWQLRFRRRFGDLTVVQRTEQRTRAALLADPEANPLDISVAALEQKPAEDDTFVVPLRVGVPLERLVLMPGAAQHQAQVSIFVMVRDARGRVSEMTRHLCPVRIANDQMQAARGRSAACGVNLRMRGGPQRVAVSLLDEVAALDSTRALDLDVGVVPAAPLPDPAGS